jgi:hypothetical protein
MYSREETIRKEIQVMAITTEQRTQLIELYVAIAGRAPDASGLSYWANEMETKGYSIAEIAAFMYDTDDAKALYPRYLTSEEVATAFYVNVLGRTPDAEGLAYWTAKLNENGVVQTMQDMIYAVKVYDGEDPAGLTSKQLFADKLAVSEQLAVVRQSDDLVLAKAAFQDLEAGSTLEEVIDDLGTGVEFVLTNGSDQATANIFTADMVWNPAGDDRILSLQDEDELTGLADRDDNTLNAEIGNINNNEGTTAVVTPQLNNIQVVNLEWTGNTNTVDLRYADDIQTLNIDKITADSNVVTLNNITTPAANLRVADAANNTTAVTFNYQRGVLSGDADTANLELDDVLAATVTQNALGAGAGIEGFETVNLNAVNGVDINTLSVNQMQELIITGDSYLDIVALTAATGAVAPEYMLLGAAGINNPSAFGLVTLDASAFTGDLTLDITNSLGGFNDPANSGAVVHGTVTGGIGDDVFWSSANAAATTVSGTAVRDVIDGGEGNNTFKTTASIAANASGDVADIRNIQTLELRQQAGAQTVDFDAFDDSLTSVLMRGEAAGTATFNLRDLGTALAEDGLVLRHGITGSTVQTVNARLKDASGADDSIAIAVENDLNTGTTFNYTLNFDGQANGTGAIENVTIADNDTESNIVTLTAAQEQTGTLTLTGGVAGQTYTVASALVASTIEASEQLSDLRLTVGDTVGTIENVDQTINLGAGDDVLTFQNIDDFTAADSITDAGGNDTVRAAFSDDSNLTLSNIENLHIIANANVELGMANADVDNLVILADIAADGDADNSPATAEPFNIAGVAVTDIITLTDTSLTELNFQADLDKDDDNTVANQALAVAAAQVADATWTQIGDSAAGDAAYKGVISDESTVANFNGVTLANNSANALTVNINAGLDDVIYGATAYNLGQLTAHGITSMDIQIADEDVTAGAANAVTTINNIYAKNMTSLSVTAQDDVNLNTVSGAALNNSLTNFDASNVGGDLTATVISLGNNATVTLADGDNTFSALGSAGKDITITAGNGDNTIAGSAQDDEITTGSGWDAVNGDRGDNVITTGAGNDTVSAKDGNDTYDVGSGINTVVDNNATGLDGTQATNTVSVNNGTASVSIDVDGVAGFEVDQMLAVGAGSDLTISWTGATMVTASAVLDGRLATVDSQAAGVVTGDANANLEIMTAAADVTFNGGAGNDVALVTDQTTASLTFNGGAGNDAAVGGVDSDIFTGGAGADKLVMQNTAAVDGVVDTVVIADGDSTASGWDIIVGFDAGVANVVAGSTIVGGDVLDLASTTIAGPAANVNGTDAGAIESHTVAANGLVTFDINDADAFAAVVVGTGANQLSLADALAYLATNLNGTSATVAFNYDSNGDGVLNAADSTFVFQDGAEDTVIELIGTYSGLEAVTGGTAGLIEIA